MYVSCTRREGIHITGVGLVILLIVPVAFVQMEGLEMLSSSKQLRVLCAGVWHNIVLAFVAALVMFFLPWLCYPFYEHGNGIQVTSIHRVSRFIRNFESCNSSARVSIERLFDYLGACSKVP